MRHLCRLVFANFTYSIDKGALFFPLYEGYDDSKIFLKAKNYLSQL